ncbi:MAG: AAA family ATPase [Desulfurococcaceae archaeon]|uniref:AAA family ATPase n=1 Tax=Staphylothermus marinus TaxID=2280 RepID=A0A7C4D8A7_STAMA
MKFTGSGVIDRIIVNGLTNLFYGEAGVGKTNLLLTIARNLCKEVYPCIYVNTEDILYYDIVSRNLDEFSNVFFVDIMDYDEFYKYVLEKLMYIPYKVLFIDSVNALFRLVVYKESSIINYGLLLGLIVKKNIDTNSYLFASAQVRSAIDESVEYTASGMSILEYWFANIFKIDRDENGRFIECVKPFSGVRVYFEITSDGIVWIS